MEILCRTNKAKKLPTTLTWFGNLENILDKYMNRILLNYVHNLWDKKDYIQDLDFEGEKYKTTNKIFEYMETYKQVYK